LLDMRMQAISRLRNLPPPKKSTFQKN